MQLGYSKGMPHRERASTVNADPLEANTLNERASTHEHCIPHPLHLLWRH
jgi:hypothetical protein